MALAVVAQPQASPAPTVDALTYDRAALVLPEHRKELVLNGEIKPHWRQGGRDRFSYRKDMAPGRSEFVMVDAATGSRSPAFDPTIVAKGLTKVLSRDVEAFNLPFADYEEAGPGLISVQIGKAAWRCSTRKPECVPIVSKAYDDGAVSSPDGKWVAYVVDHNLWMGSADGKVKFPLTTDGAEHDSYGGAPEVSQVNIGRFFQGGASRPILIWSPDSKRLLTQQVDERHVRDATIVQSVPGDGSYHPKTYSFRYALPNDQVLPQSKLWIFDVATRSGRKVDEAPLTTPYTGLIESKQAWWSADSAKIFLVHQSRYAKDLYLDVINPSSGAARNIITEHSNTFIQAADLVIQWPMISVLKTGDIIWYSQRDGNGHLYLYNGTTGALERQLTSGAWSVRGILKIDETKGALYATASGEGLSANPYFRKIIKISLIDGSAKILTTEDADHDVASFRDSILSNAINGDVTGGFSPSGRYFVENASRVDTPNIAVLRRADGHRVAEIEQADVSGLTRLGLPSPEPFSALAADGKTPLFGVILKPPDFDPRKSYPILDSVYPGPQTRRVKQRYLDLAFDPDLAESFAALGFVVVLVDGRGTPGRTKPFLDESYGTLGNAGHLDDHVSVIKTLGERFPYMDLGRVGVYGGSAGGFAAASAMLLFPDFFKVGVASSGNFDQRNNIAVWGETYNGPDNGTNYRDASDATFANQLQGKLLLLHGDMDKNVLLSQTFELADALISANKDFDLIVIPNAGHDPMTSNKYARRKAWDYMVTNLLGSSPPKNYTFPRSAAEVLGRLDASAESHDLEARGGKP